MTRRALPAVQIRAGVLLVLALLALGVARVLLAAGPAPDRLGDADGMARRELPDWSPAAVLPVGPRQVPHGNSDVDPPLPATQPR